MDERLTLDWLQAFSDVAELGSFSAAARRRRLTQPAISLRVMQLERALRVRLIERAGRRVRTTAAGNILYLQVRRIDEAVAAAIEALADYRSHDRGRIVVGAGSDYLHLSAPPILGELMRKHPGLEIVMKAGTVVDIMSWIDDSVVDLAIVSRPPSSQAHKVIPILDDELVAIYPVGTRDVPSTFSPAQLSSRPMIAPERGGGTWPLIADWFDRAGLAWRPAMEVSSIEAIKSLVSTGFGYAIIPRIAAGNAEALGMAYASLHPRIHRTLTLVVRQDKQLTRQFGAVMQAFTGLKDYSSPAA